MIFVQYKIAELFYVTKDVEKWGSGLKRYLQRM